MSSYECVSGAATGVRITGVLARGRVIGCQFGLTVSNTLQSRAVRPDFALSLPLSRLNNNETDES